MKYYSEKILNLLRKIDAGYEASEEEERELAGVREIDWSRASLEELPRSMGRLTGVEYLDLSSNKVSDISALGSLTSLRFLILDSNNVSDISALGSLSSLTSLYLSFNKISDIRALGGLTSLTSLYLSFNKVSDISMLEKLTSLTTLGLKNTKVTFIGGHLKNCRKLSYLDLSGLVLDKLPECLFSLDLEYKNEGVYFLKGINLRHTTLRTQPVSLFFQPRELIADYYAQRQIPVNETKVIFLGWEGVGKSHTIERIKNNNHKIDKELKETPGISITPITFEEDISYRINFWDFGGQEIMHSMHRCFLTERTSYAIVVSTRFGDLNSQARDWLKSVESFAGRSPVLIFINEWSEGTYYGLDEGSLREEYPNIVGVVRCSAKDGEDWEFARVTEAVKRLARGSDSVGMDFPEKWENIRRRVIEEGEKHYYINLTKFRRICRENGVQNEDIQGWLLNWFNDLGECFSYRLEDLDTIPEKDFKVLNPEWLTNAIYIIIREMRDVASDGFVSHRGIYNKLDHSDKGTLPGVGYSEEECQYVLAVMRKFLLSYKVPGKKQEFIPALLPDDRPAGLAFEGARGFISYEMRYQYLPENVIHNLMIGMYDWLDYEKCWRKGMLVRIPEFQNEGLLAVLDMSRGDDVLRIRIYAYGETAPWKLLQELRGRLRKINEAMNLTAEDRIIIEGEEEAPRVDRLLNLKKRGKQTYEGELNDYNINELLGQTFGEPQVNRLDALRSRDAHDLRNEKPGEVQLPEMRQALDQAEEDWLLADRTARKKVLQHLIEACMQLQGEPKYSKEKEDPRNRFLKIILNNRELNVRDQTQYGHSPGSENAGELDLVVMKNNTVPLTIIEALNLDSVASGKIDGHVGKLLKDYNPNGLPELFLVAYVQKSVGHFQDFWKSYLAHMSEGDTGEFRFERVEERATDLHFLKHAEAVYACNGAEILVHHICVRMGD